MSFASGFGAAGSGFAVFTGWGARLQRALIQFFLDYNREHHRFLEVSTPYLVRRDAMFGTGQLPKMEDDMYRTEPDDLFLIPTAEVSITNLFAGQQLTHEDLPIYRMGYSPCFRREAGTYGKETRGLVRVHQFDKVELVKIVAPETGYDEHEALARDVGDIFEALELSYRVMLLCTGDLSFAAAKCYDFEVWAPGLETWLEASSCSTFEDFQARRMGLRFRRGPGARPEHPHTLNASGVALPRTYAALLETHQTAQGTVRVPAAPSDSISAISMTMMTITMPLSSPSSRRCDRRHPFAAQAAAPFEMLAWPQVIVEGPGAQFRRRTSDVSVRVKTCPAIGSTPSERAVSAIRYWLPGTNVVICRSLMPSAAGSSLPRCLLKRSHGRPVSGSFSI